MSQKSVGIEDHKLGVFCYIAFILGSWLATSMSKAIIQQQADFTWSSSNAWVPSMSACTNLALSMNCSVDFSEMKASTCPCSPGQLAYMAGKTLWHLWSELPKYFGEKCSVWWMVFGVTKSQMLLVHNICSCWLSIQYVVRVCCAKKQSGRRKQSVHLRNHLEHVHAQTRVRPKWKASNWDFFWLCLAWLLRKCGLLANHSQWRPGDIGVEAS